MYLGKVAIEKEDTFQGQSFPLYTFGSSHAQSPGEKQWALEVL